MTAKYTIKRTGSRDNTMSYWLGDEYAAAMTAAVRREDGEAFRGLLLVNPGPQQGKSRAEMPAEITGYRGLPRALGPVIESYVRLMQAIYVHSNMKQAFSGSLALVSLLNRFAESQLAWVCPALIGCASELISVHTIMQKSDKNPENLENVAAAINKLFKICLTDKLLEPQQLKKLSIHFFLAALIKIYFKLNRLELAKSLEKALVGTGTAIPTIVNSPVPYRKHVITYLYYSALLSLDDSDFEFAEKKLLTALDFLLYAREKHQRQTEQILFLLAPLKMYLYGTHVLRHVISDFPNLEPVHRLLQAVSQGDIAAYESLLSRHQSLFLRRHVFILAVQLKTLAYVPLVKAAYSANSEAQTPHIVPFSLILAAFDFAEKKAFSVEETECVLARLIVLRRIKGYLSDGQRCVVLLKNEPFPKIT